MPTEIWSSRFRSGSAQRDEVEEETTLIESRVPHLAEGGNNLRNPHQKSWESHQLTSQAKNPNTRLKIKALITPTTVSSMERLTYGQMAMR